jgi:ketosteroid isomerase-like protein
MHQNEELLRREYEARATCDDRALAEAFTEDVVWHVPGKNAIAAEYRGIDRVVDSDRDRKQLPRATVRADDGTGVVEALSTSRIRSIKLTISIQLVRDRGLE